MFHQIGDDGRKGGLRADRVQLPDATRREGVEGVERRYKTRTHGGVRRSVGVRQVDVRATAREVLRPRQGQSC